MSPGPGNVEWRTCLTKWFPGSAARPHAAAGPCPWILGLTETVKQQENETYCACPLVCWACRSSRVSVDAKEGRRPSRRAYLWRTNGQMDHDRCSRRALLLRRPLFSGASHREDVYCTKRPWIGGRSAHLAGLPGWLLLSSIWMVRRPVGVTAVQAQRRKRR